MSWLDQIMELGIVYRIGWAIIHSAWQGLAVAGMFGLTLIVIPKRMGNLRYGCGCLALLAVLAAFCTTAFITGPRPGEPAATNPWRTQLAASGTIPTTNEGTAAASTVTRPQDSGPAAEPAVTPEVLRTTPQARLWRQYFARAVSPWTDYVCGIWLVGVFAMSIWNLGGWVAVRRLRMIGTYPAPERLISALDELRKRLAIRRTVKLLQSTVVKVPMTIGWLKPVILIPASILTELSPQHIEALIAHELAHVRRCDYLVNLLQTVVETLFFHHPVIWWISHRVRLEREYCCDNAVVRLTADQVNYAKALAEIAERKDNLPQVAVAADGGPLVDRIRRILGLERESSLLRNRSAGWAIVALVFIAAAFAVCIGLSSDTLWAAPYKYGGDADDGTYQTFQKMIGTWYVNAEKSSGAANVRRIEIKPDANCIRHESAENDPNPKTFYDHVRLKDNGLVVSGYWGKQTFALTLEDTTMTWTEGNTHFTFEREIKAPPAKEAAAHPIIGKWKSTDVPEAKIKGVEVFVLEFNPDGTGRSAQIGPDGKTVHSEQIVYRIEGDTILAQGPDPDDKWEPIQWRIQGEALYLIDDGKIYRFTRGNEREAYQSSAVPGSNLDVAGAAMEFHVLPENNGDRPDLTQDAIKKYCTQLDEEGPLAGKARGDSYQWAGVDAGFTGGNNLIQGQYRGKKYVLFSATAGESLWADGRWGLADVSSGQDDMGRPCIDFRLDTKGSEQFYALTRDNVRKQLAILINGTVYSAPMIMTPVGGRGKIAGQFSRNKVEQLVAALKAGIPAPATDAALFFGTWEMVEGTGRADEMSDTWTFKPDGVFVSSDSTGMHKPESGTWGFKDGRMIVNGIEEINVQIEDDQLIVTANRTNTRAVFKKQVLDPEQTAANATSVVGTWRAEKGWHDGVEKDVTTQLELNADGTFTMDVVSAEYGHKTDTGRYAVRGNIVTFQVVNASTVGGVLEGDTLTITAENDKVVLRKYNPDAVDRRFAGSWKSGEFIGDIGKEITALFLTLNADLTFVLLGEGADTGEPIRGMWRTDGDILTLHPQTERDRTAMDFVKSARYEGGTIRLAIGAGAAVLERVTANPFAGPEHPMYRAELTSHEWPTGQTWLDLDTGRIIGRNEYAAADKNAYELTIIGNCRLLLHSTPGRILPLHDAGMNFNKAGAAAVKYLASLHQSKLTQYDYKEGLVAAVLTDQGNLAVIYMTRTGSDQTPVAWSLGRIVGSTDGNVQVEAINLAAQTLKIPTAASARSVTLPDLDEQPAFVDLATGEMIVMPEGIEKDDNALRTHLTQLSKGDLGFDKQLIVLRGGSACLWDGVNSTAMTPIVHEGFNIRVYDLANIPCRLLITTGDGKQFDVSVLEKTADGRLKIAYRPLGTKVPTPAAESAPAVNAADRARAAELTAQLKLVRMAMDCYELDEGRRPDLSGGWQALLDRTGKGPYIKAAPVNPFTAGSNIAADADADWRYDAASGKLKAVVPFTPEKARQLGFDLQNDVVLRAQSPAETEKRIERISFAKDSSIREALQMLGKAFKKNIIPSDGVQGTVPLRDLWNVTLEETLRAILGTHRYVVDGDFICVYTAGEYETQIGRPTDPLSHARAWLSALQRADHAAAMHLCKPGSTEAGASVQLLGSFSFAEATVEQVLLSDKQAAALIGPAKGLGNRTARFGISMEPVSGAWQIRDIDYLPEGKESSFISKFRQAYPDATPMVVPTDEGTAGAGFGRMTVPKDAGRRVTYALDKIASLMRYVESQRDGDIAALSGYFDQINEFCDDLQGKNGPAPGRDEWGGLDDAQIEAVLKLLSDVEEAAEGCRELARGGHKELLDQHWQLLKHQYSRLCTAMSLAAGGSLQTN